MKISTKHIVVPGMLTLLLLCFIVINTTADDNLNRKTQVRYGQEYPVLIEGIYYSDSFKKRLFNGPYREYFESGDIKLEMYIVQGKPDGTYVVYYPNAKIKEVRSYLNGLFNGIWRSYNEDGVLIAQAEYQSGLKHGLWKIWDEKGVLRYEMHYDLGKKTGTWYMWDESGKLISEKNMNNQ